MDRILSGLDFIFAYVDDVIMTSHLGTEHLHHLRLLSSDYKTPAWWSTGRSVSSEQ
jgi:hypothetical protein